MSQPGFPGSTSRKFIIIISGIITALIIVFFIWQHNKYRIVYDTLASTIARKTSNLYTIHYDSIHFDEISGKAYLKNIHVFPDTALIKNRKPEDLPFVLLDITIASLRISGVRTDKALLGKQIVGDSIVIDQVAIILYFVKPLQKHTKIVTEVNTVYQEILGKLKRIKVGNVSINNVNVKGVRLFTKEKGFDLVNGNIQLFDVLIDSAHNLDTSRTLFCKQAALEIPSFVTYNNNRPELRVNKMIFSGKARSLSFGDIALSLFESKNPDSTRLLHATRLNLKGLNTNEMVINKNIIVDTITCGYISFHEPSVTNPKVANNSAPKQPDTTGFMHVYRIDMKHLNFPKVHFIPAMNDRYTVGNIAIKINEVKADEILKIQNDPLDYSKEVEIKCDKVSITSKDGLYKYTFQKAALNSLPKQLKIGSVIIKPSLDEQAFANKAHYQKDRYDAVLSGIALKNIDMKNLLAKKIIASDLIIDKVSAKIYTDLQKPMSGKSKIGNSPAQLLKNLPIPVNISRAGLSNTFIEYREKEVLTDSTGDVKFSESTININNITNTPEAIQKNNAMGIAFDSKALRTIPVNGTFTFFLDDDGGKFTADGHISAFDVHLLNEVSVPMALIRLNTGTINSMDFNFTGSNLEGAGKLVMKYSNLNVDVLKGDKKSNGVKKKGLVSLIANIIVKNDNPHNGKLREVNPHSGRNAQKSFFNLLWKTILTGMKKTAGIP